MALTVTALFKPERLRPAHLDDGIAIYTGQPEDAFEAVDLTAEKASLNTAIDGLVTTFKNLWPFADEADFDNQTDALNTAIQALVTGTAHIENTYDASIEDVLTQVKSDLNTAIAAQYNSGTNYACTRCGADGRYPASNDPDETVSTEKHCISCDALGRTKEPLTPTVQTWPIPNTDITL